MNADVACLEQGWHRRKFSMVLVSVFVVQLGLLLFFGKKTPAQPVDVASTTAFSMLIQNASPEMLDALLVTDPTLFVVPNHDSFSGAAWMKHRLVDYSPAEWSEPPSWLTLPQEKLTRALQDFVQANQKPLLPVAQKKAPLEPSPLLTDGLTQAKPRITLEGEIAARFVGQLPELNAWQGTEPLDRSIVQIAVNEAGQVLSAKLLSRSGMVSADQNALRLAAGLRFAPVPVSSVVWGRVIFPWRTDPMTVMTNSIPVSELR